jgi:hypothetical protein
VDTKSRLAGRGDLEDCRDELRKDSPAADQEAVCIVFIWCASKRLRIRSGDIENVDFQGMKLTRMLLVTQPGGGLPDAEVKPTDYLLAQVLIYRTTDD